MAGEKKSADVTLNEALDRIETANGWAATNLSYGWQVEEAKHPEATFTMQYTTRQDGKTSWLVTLAEPDDAVKFVSGMSRTGEAHRAMAEALRQLTISSRWIEPLVVAAEGGVPAQQRRWMVMDRAGKFLVGVTPRGAREWTSDAAEAKTFETEFACGAFIFEEFKSYEIVIEGIQPTGEQTNA